MNAFVIKKIKTKLMLNANDYEHIYYKKSI